MEISSRRYGKQRGMRRDRDCRSCKSRTIKCDLNRPRCLPCVRAGLACGNYPQRVVWVDERSKKSFPAPYRLTTPSRVWQEWDESNHHSFFKSLALVCSGLTTLDTRKHFANQHASGQIVRLAEELMACMKYIMPRAVLLSASTLEAGDVEVLAVSYRIAALHKLNEAVGSADPFAIIGIAAFALFGLVDGSDEWHLHLKGAKYLLDGHCGTSSQVHSFTMMVPGGAEILSWLVYWDLVGAIVKRGEKLVFEDWHRQTMDRSVLDKIGCLADSFDLLIQVAKGNVVTDPLGMVVRAMQQALVQLSDSSDKSHAAQAYRCAATIAVLGGIMDLDIHSSIQATLASAVDQLCFEIRSIGPRSPYYIHLALPAYLAGINTSTTQQCDSVRFYWQHCKLGDAPRYRRGLERCEDVWRKRNLM